MSIIFGVRPKQTEILTQRMLDLRCMARSPGIKANVVFGEFSRGLSDSRMAGSDAAMNCGLGVGWICGLERLNRKTGLRESCVFRLLWFLTLALLLRRAGRLCGVDGWSVCSMCIPSFFRSRSQYLKGFFGPHSGEAQCFGIGTVYGGIGSLPVFRQRKPHRSSLWVLAFQVGVPAVLGSTFTRDDDVCFVASSRG